MGNPRLIQFFKPLTEKAGANLPRLFCCFKLRLQFYSIYVLSIMKTLSWICLWIGICQISILDAVELRRFRSVDGGELIARVLKVEEGVVHLERKDGKHFETPLSQFSSKDRQYLLSLDPRFQQSLDRAKAHFHKARQSVSPPDDTKRKEEISKLEGGELWKFYLKAIPILKESAAEGNVPAQYNLGVAYLEGLGLRQDYGQAVHWFRLASDGGDTRAQFRLGQMCLHGRGVGQDDGVAMQWFLKAAEAGHPKAQSHVGAMYIRALGVERNEMEALRWLKSAAQIGEAEAQIDLAIMYMLGLGGLREDPEMAASWLGQAAKQGHPFAQYELGVAYRAGIGVSQDFEKAAYWLHQSASQRHADAQLDLGLMYLLGLGVDKNAIECGAWFHLAASTGHRRGMEALRQLQKKFSDDEQMLVRKRTIELSKLLASNQ